MTTYWVGDGPKTCELCDDPIGQEFIDGRLGPSPWSRMGSWACVCPECHAAYGTGLGLGRGQRYRRQDDGRWLKVAG